MAVGRATSYGFSPGSVASTVAPGLHVWGETAHIRPAAGLGARQRPHPRGAPVLLGKGQVNTPGRPLCRGPQERRSGFPGEVWGLREQLCDKSLKYLIIVN